MASRVAGLKIELEIDGSKVTQYLSTFQRDVKKSDSALKDLEKSLKLDPTNATLLKQKFDLLGESVQKTQQYLNQLKQKYQELASKQDPTQKDIDQMRNLQREISDTEQKLKSLTKEYENFGSVGKQQLIAVGEQIQAAGDKMIGVGQNLTSIGGQIERIGAPIQAAFAAATKEGMSFEKGMSSVKAVTGATAEEFEALTNEARNMAKQTVFSASEVSEAEYYMGLAGWSAQESIDGLAGVLDLAAAGQVDLGRASSIVVDGITALGLSAEDSTHFVNVMAAAMSNSNTTVDLLGESFKYAAPLAGTLGYSVEDLTLGLGLMASAGIKGSQAGTGLRMAFKNMADETKIAAAQAAGFNITMEDGYGNALPLRDVIGQLREEFGGVNVELLDADGNLKTGEELWEEYGDSLPASQMEKFRAISELVGVRALPGVLGMVNASQEDFDDLANAIDNADGSFVEMNGEIYPLTEAMELFGEEAVITEGRVMGAAEGMRNIQLDNLQGDLTLLRDNFADLGIEIYEKLQPHLRELTDWIGSLADKFRNLSPEAQNIILIVAGIIAALGPLLILIGQMSIGFGALTKAIGATMSFVAANPIVLIIAGIIAAIILLATHWEEFKTAVIEIWESIKEFATALWEGIKWVFVDTFTTIRDKAVEIWTAIKDKVVEIWTAIKDWVTETITAIKETIGTIWEAIKTKISEVITAISTTITTVWTAIKTTITTVINTIKTTITTVWNAIKIIITTVVNAIKSVITTVWNAIKNTLSSVLTGISTTFSNIWNGIKNTVSNVVNGLKSTISNIWNSIKSTTTSVWNGIKTAITTPITAAKNTVKSIIDKIKGFFPLSIGKIFSSFKLPHVSVSWKDIAGIVKIPSFSVDWYAKAMKNGMLLDGATIFGMNRSGQPMGGGEVGKEWIVGQNSLLGMIQQAVGNNGISPEAIYNAVVAGMEAANVEVYMDGTKVTRQVSKVISSQQGANLRYYGV